MLDLEGMTRKKVAWGQARRLVGPQVELPEVEMTHNYQVHSSSMIAVGVVGSIHWQVRCVVVTTATARGE